MPKVTKVVVRLRRFILNKNIVTINGILNFSRFRLDVLVKSLQGRHFREACHRPDRGAGVHKELNFLDSRFHGNDNNGCFLTFYEFIKLQTPNFGHCYGKHES